MKKKTFLRDTVLFRQVDQEKTKLLKIDISNLDVNSSQAVIWRCLDNKSHHWQSSIKSMIRNSTCPHCLKDLSIRNLLVFKKDDILLNLFSSISTFFVFSVIIFSITLPQLFKETSAIKFGYNKQYSDPTERQINLIFSGIGSYPLIIALSLFIPLGIYIFSSTSRNADENDSDTYWIYWKRILNISFALLAFLVTSFSIWRA